MVLSIIGISQNIEDIRWSIDQIAKTEGNVLVIGEKGVGKDLVVQSLYHRSERVGKPFVKIDCGLVSGTSMEIQIFGCEPTTSCDRRVKRRDLFEQIDGGVLFLDKIDEISVDLQTKFFKLLQGWDCFPSSDPGKPSRSTIWTIAASSRNLDEDTRTGKFRQDLLCRLSTRKIVIEPLRRRPEDIPCLVHHFMQEYADCLNVGTLKGPKRKTIRRMVEYHWPGNVKELQSVLKRMMIFKDYGPTYQYRIPGLDEDFSLPADNLYIINTPESLSIKKFIVELPTV